MKKIGIIISILVGLFACSIFIGMFTQDITTNSNTNSNENDTTEILQQEEEKQEEEKIEITNLKFNESEIEMDIKESKEIFLEIFPENANVENIEFNSTDNEIAVLEEKGIENDSNKLILNIKTISEGECEVYARTDSGIESNGVKLKIIDNERIENEKKELEEKNRKEEEAKKQAEEQKKKEEQEEQRRQEEQRKTSTTINNTNSKTNNSSSNKNSTSSTKTNSNNTHGKKVYRTPTGKRYHFDPDCGGKNSYQTTLESAKSSGLTPCKKCAY